jgi:glycosyltransferase involved in cell wall biosynthesis
MSSEFDALWTHFPNLIYTPARTEFATGTREGRSMRLVHLTASPFFGGPERQMLGLARALPSDYETTVVSFGEAGRCEPFLAEVRRDGFKAVRLVHDTPHLLAARRELTDLLHELDADLVLCHSYKANLVGRPAARKAGVPVWAVARGWTGQDLRVRWYDRLDRFLLSRMDRVIAVSNGMAAAVRAAGVPSSKIRVIRNAARDSAFREPDPVHRRAMEAMFGNPGERIVLSANRLTPDKGTHVLIDAARTVVRNDPGARFLICGDGASRPDLEQQVREAGLQDVVVFAGFRPDLDAWMPNADLLALPSFNEGLPNVVLEACACGVPCVATAVFGTPEVLRDGINGYLVPAGDAAKLAGRITDLLADPDLRRRMGAAGRELVGEQFTFAAQARQYVELFEEMGVGRACAALTL